MAEPLCDVDLDALAPKPKRIKLGGKIYKTPGDMPMSLFLRIQAFEQRVAAGESEVDLLSELQDDLLGLFQVHHPELKVLPEIGVVTLLQSLGAIYSGPPPAGEPPPPNRAARRATPPAKRKTLSAGKASTVKPRARARATSR